MELVLKNMKAMRILLIVALCLYGDDLTLFLENEVNFIIAVSSVIEHKTMTECLVHEVAPDC